jgi:hypothetical protein
MACLECDLKECVTYLRFPADHHQRIRTTRSPRVAQRRRPPARESDSAVSDRARVLVAVIRQPDHGVEALARDSR